ncbi:MAG TPA: EAL domain-containing protein [Dokdonella sp.]|uniref:EAL domain-containing protein n=1 Tax=Dokdonella sp. TaxID=2291710 RepID=UPI002C61083D|nr:EAL domain-containing protein [Dokdonella sp.]HUD42092.1 EAL domain-containing protein [Dokdonella sp.]
MRSQRRYVAAQELIFAEGDPPTTAFLVESGRIEISTVQHGRVQVLGELGPGELLGEMAVLDNSLRSTSARALSDCVLLPIDRDQFSERLEAADPVVRALLMSQLARYRSALAMLTRGGEIAPGLAAPVPHVDPGLDKIRLESELRLALERGDLDVLLQPLQDMSDGTIAGYESLIRWRHPERGQVSPAEFIRLAEETSLILPIGDYVLDRVCAMLERLRERRVGALPFIALNVSARQLADACLVPRWIARLAAHSLPPDRLRIEITESLMFDTPRIAQLLDACHAAGMTVALDDFGTGYANLGVLADLDFDCIKLDRSLVHRLSSSRGLALVRAIVAMARGLRCQVVAEGVETATQYALLRDLGCRYAQGWLVGHPLPIHEVVAD